MHLLCMIESNILFTNQQLFSEPSWEFWLVEWSNIRNHDEILITAGDNIFMMYFAMSHDAEVYWLVHAELGCKQFVVIESYICTSIKRVITLKKKKWIPFFEDLVKEPSGFEEISKTVYGFPNSVIFSLGHCPYMVELHCVWPFPGS